jgi:hypothetical protein
MENDENEKLREARNAYARMYRRENKERIKRIHERYWQKKFEKMNEVKNG